MISNQHHNYRVLAPPPVRGFGLEYLHYVPASWVFLASISRERMLFRFYHAATLDPKLGTRKPAAHANHPFYSLSLTTLFTSII